ncbi:MAG: DUF6503 family protein [Saprospiraceae bacterium]
MSDKIVDMHSNIQRFNNYSTYFMTKILVLNIIILVGIVSISKAQHMVDFKSEAIIQSCVEAHGGKAYKNVNISFDFRKYRFSILQTNKRYKYQRSYTDSLNNTILDILDNGDFRHLVNGKIASQTQKQKDRDLEGVNSVAYFVLLPFKLTDQAVRSKYLGTITIDGNDYDKILIWFDREGGGKDHEDVFCYWIHSQYHTLDYLAYANGGPRFRKATRRENIKGVVFQNYENYEILDKSIETSEYDAAFLSGKSTLLSIIEQSNYIVNNQ